MMPTCRATFFLAAPAFLSLAIPGAVSAQSLDGQLVQLTDRAPNKTKIIQDFGSQAITPSGAVFPSALPGNLVTTTVTPTQITFANLTNGTEYFFGPYDFNGYVVSEIGSSPALISGISIDPSTDVAGFTLNNVTFDPTDVFADFQDTMFSPGQEIVLDLNPAAVPEASTIISFSLLLTLGLGGVMVAARRKKATV